MALDPHQIVGAGPASDTAPRAPLAGTRRQSLQRLQVGLFGLGAVILLVGLANIIISTAQQNQAAVVEELPPVAPGDVPAPRDAPRDPLADAGVAPDLPVDPAADPAADPATGANPASGEPLVPID